MPYIYNSKTLLLKRWKLINAILLSLPFTKRMNTVHILQRIKLGKKGVSSYNNRTVNITLSKGTKGQKDK